ncbi:MAG: rod shape-determining protein MreC, partial [Candidatus Competibacterales bacterium]|nr:rod shape-determining protein MreC [Candidatus Competibacterales bacterium]
MSSPRREPHQGGSALALNLRLIACLVLSLALMLLDRRGDALQPLRATLATLAYPLQAIVELPVELGGRAVRLLGEQRALVVENERLRRQLLFHSAQMQKLDALEAENRRLRALLASAARLPERVLIAELLTVAADPYRHRIELDKGSLQGVYSGQPLLDQYGIVGQVVQVNPLSASAILITDPNHTLPVQVNRNGLRTLVTGTGNFQRLDLPYIPNNYDVQVGDLLITSGLGGRFPRGYPVGRITGITFDPGSPFARVSARPLARLDRLREVLL